MAQIRGLFDQVSIGTINTKNRICIPPMVIYGCSDDSGMATEVNVQHYARLAKGGAGLVIQEATCVTKRGRLSLDQLGIWSDAHIPGLKRIVEAVHAQGCPVFVQLHHAGAMGIDEEHLCPSIHHFQGKYGAYVSKEMTMEEIAEVREAFVRAGHRAYLAGYDGVELHGCHSYLLCQFLNRRINRRKDVYGTEPIRLVLEIAEGIRNVTSPSFVIGIRLGGFEPTLEDGIFHAKVLAENGIQFLDISYGFSGEMDTNAPGDPGIPDIIRAASAIRSAVGIPVFAVGGIRLPQDAEHILQKTNVDMVDVGRSALVDPEWPNRAKQGQQPGKCLDCKICQWRLDAKKCPGRKLLYQQEKKL